MLNRSVARRYAEAFFSIAREQNQIDSYQEELEKIVQGINTMEYLKEYFDHLLIPAKEKKEVAQKIFAEQISPITLNFLCMIIDKRREPYFEVIYKEYVEMANESRGIKKAELTAAAAISDEELEKLAERLSAASGKTVQLKLTVDPSLLGGIKIRMGDQIIDGTVAKKLEMLKRELKLAKIS
jgi:F-type H+-transporting ATPase subunit delta